MTGARIQSVTRDGWIGKDGDGVLDDPVEFVFVLLASPVDLLGWFEEPCRVVVEVGLRWLCSESGVLEPQCASEWRRYSRWVVTRLRPCAVAASVSSGVLSSDSMLAGV